jgi:hypothetical protein
MIQDILIVRQDFHIKPSYVAKVFLQGRATVPQGDERHKWRIHPRCC